MAAGCGKKPAPNAEAATENASATEPPKANAPGAPSEKDKLLGIMKTKRGEPQRNAAETLAALAESDPTVFDGLLELLRDRTTAGAGKTHPTQATSTREAAALALLWCGPKGEAVLKEKGFAILREGLSDRDAVIREHTAHTVGVIGPMAKPLAASVQRLCSDSDANVRAIAFDAIQSIGAADVAGMASLLSSEDPTTRGRAAEVINTLTDIPADAVPSLARALEDEDEIIRVAAATGVVIAGGKGASAVTAEKLAAAIKKSYPENFNQETARLDGPEFMYWRALAALGKLAVDPTAKLLNHSNPLVRAHAARILGELGADAKPTVDALHKALTDVYANVALEAACSLCRLGEKTDDAVKAVEFALASELPGVAAFAIEAVARMGPLGKPLKPEVLKKLTSPLPETRYAAVEFIGTLEPGEGASHVKELAKLVTDEEPVIRGRVASVLASFGPAAAPVADAIGTALPDEKDEGVRDQLVEALVAMGPGAKAAVAGLLPLVADPAATSVLRAKVIGAVAEADPGSADVAATVLKACGDADVTVRIAAATGLGGLNPLPPNAVTTLVKMARSDTRMEARLAAVRGLVAAGPRAKAARTDLEALAKGTLPGVDLWARVALAAVDGDVTKAAGAVREGLGNKSMTVRTAAAEGLLLVGPAPSDAPTLVKLLKDPAGGVRKSAAIAAGRLGPTAKEAVPRLADLLTDQESEVRVAAADALGKIGPAALSAVPKLREARKDPLVTVSARKALERLGVKSERPGR